MYLLIFKLLTLKLFQNYILLETKFCVKIFCKFRFCVPIQNIGFPTNSKKIFFLRATDVIKPAKPPLI